MKHLIELKNRLVSRYETAKFRAFTTAIAIQAGGLSSTALAQDDGAFRMPTATIPGVSDDSNTADMVVNLFKYAGLLVLWVFVIVMGIVLVKNIIKSINKVRRDEETKWADVIGDIIGNALGMLLVVVLASWLTTYLT
jgi:hypothetical protein